MDDARADYGHFVDLDDAILDDEREHRLGVGSFSLWWWWWLATRFQLAAKKKTFALPIGWRFPVIS